MVEFQSKMVIVLQDEYGIEVRDIKPLEGLVDRTYAINTNQYVAKLILDPNLQDPRALEAETSLFQFLKEKSFPVAGIVKTKQGALCTTVEIVEPGHQDTSRRAVQVQSFLTGALWFAKGVNPEICETIGKFVGQLHIALESYKNDHYLQTGGPKNLVSFGGEWDCAEMKELVKSDTRKYRICEQALNVVDSCVRSVETQLPMQQINFDINPRNVMLSDDCKSVVGLIDLGTSRYTCRIYEIAIVIPALLAKDTSSDFSCVRAFMKAYRSEVNLTELEISSLFACCIGRLLLLYLGLDAFKVKRPAYNVDAYASSMFGTNGWETLDEMLNNEEKKARLQAALLGGVDAR